MASIAAIMDALANQIDTRLSPLIGNLQVVARFVPNPTPPCVDVYPSDPFQEPLGYGKGNNQFFLTVRARVHTVDNEAGQETLLAMMDPEASTSMAQAIMYSRTLSGTVGKLNVSAGPSAFGVFADTGGQGNLLGCTWTVQITP